MMIVKPYLLCMEQSLERGGSRAESHLIGYTQKALRGQHAYSVTFGRVVH